MFLGEVKTAVLGKPVSAAMPLYSTGVHKRSCTSAAVAAASTLDRGRAEAKLWRIELTSSDTTQRSSPYRSLKIAPYSLESVKSYQLKDPLQKLWCRPSCL